MMQAKSGNAGHCPGGGWQGLQLDELVTRAVGRDDVYVAMALHPAADAVRQRRLEAVLFATARRRRRISAAPYSPASIIDRLAGLARDSKLRARVARHPAASADTLRGLVGDDDSEPLAAAVAAHGNAPPELLAGLNWRRSAAVRKALCANPNTRREDLAEIAADSPLAALKLIARHPNADPDTLRDLWRRGDGYLRGEVAANEHCPQDVQQMAEKSDVDLLRRKLASNPAAEVERLMRLLQDPTPQVRAASVRNLLLPAQEIGALCDDPSRQVRRSKARRAGLTPAVIDRLSTDEDHWVRRWIARNPATPEGILRRLAKDGAAAVRRAVARNPNCPSGTLNELAGDSESWVRAGVAFRRDLPETMIRQLATEQDPDILSGIGQNRMTPTGILQDIAKNKDKDIRRAVILNDRAPLTVLKTLLDDPYPLNRAILAEHPALTEAEHAAMLDDPEPQVRFAAARMLVRSPADTRPTA